MTTVSMRSRPSALWPQVFGPFGAADTGDGSLSSSSGGFAAEVIIPVYHHDQGEFPGYGVQMDQLSLRATVVSAVEAFARLLWVDTGQTPAAAVAASQWLCDRIDLRADTAGGDIPATAGLATGVPLDSENPNHESRFNLSDYFVHAHPKIVSGGGLICVTFDNVATGLDGFIGCMALRSQRL